MSKMHPITDVVVGSSPTSKYTNKKLEWPILTLLDELHSYFPRGEIIPGLVYQNVKIFEYANFV